jgi:succinate dehydrogenase/fumarate reductase flavoprotein subunit
MPVENVSETDVLVIGGGMSGIFAAMKAREEGVSVTLIDRAHVGKAGDVFYAEGFYSVFNPEWGHSLSEWKRDIANGGDYMNNPEWTEITLKESYDRYKDLLSWGVRFQTGKDGELLKFRSGPLEAVLIGMGWTWFPALREELIKHGVKVMDRLMAVDLLKQDGRVAGAVGFDVRSGDFYVLKAKSTVICATGAGEAMAFRAGADVSCKEFISGGNGPFSYSPGFYDEKGAKVSLEGKEVKPAPAGGWDGGGVHYVNKYVDAEGNKVSRWTIASALHTGRGPVLWNMDAATPEEISDTLHEIAQGGTGFKLDRVGFDLKKGGLYTGVTPGAASMAFASFGGLTGIWSTDTQGGTSVPGLYAAGDAYSSRAIGSKYPWWGFALRNASVTGARAGRSAAAYASQAGKIQVDKDQIAGLKSNIYAPLQRAGGFDVNWVRIQLSGITGPYYIRVIKHGERLKAALTLVQFLRSHVDPLMYAKRKDAHGLALVHEAKSRLLFAETALQASLFRTESRGLHYREDYPRRDDPNWLAAVKIRPKDGGMELVKVPFPKEVWPDLSIPYRVRYPSEYPNEQPLSLAARA